MQLFHLSLNISLFYLHISTDFTMYFNSQPALSMFLLLLRSISLIYRVEYRHSKSYKSMRLHIFFSGAKKFVIWECSLYHSCETCSDVPKGTQNVHSIPFSAKLEEWRLKKYYLNLSKVNVCGMPIILYGSESLLKSDIICSDFTVTQLLMKLFKTVNHNFIHDCCNLKVSNVHITVKHHCKTCTMITTANAIH